MTNGGFCLFVSHVRRVCSDALCRQLIGEQRLHSDELSAVGVGFIPPDPHPIASGRRFYPLVTSGLSHSRFIRPLSSAISFQQGG